MELLSSQSFQIDLLMLPERIQRRLTWALRDIADAPTSAGGRARRYCRDHFSNLYRYRIDGYRLVYCLGARSLKLMAAGRPEEVRRRFVPPGSTEKQTVQALVPVHTDRAETAAVDTGEDTAEKSGAGGGDGAGRSFRVLADLLDRWQIAPRVVRQILACTRVDQLLALDITDDVRQRVLHWLYPPMVHQIQEEPVFVVPRGAELDRFLATGAGEFRLKLDPDQERIVARQRKGPTLVTGGPGSGKSLVALYRIHRLLQPDHQRGLFGGTPPRVLLVTFTTTLIEVSRQRLTGLLGAPATNVTVVSLDKLVQRVLVRAGRRYRPAGEAVRQRALERALAAVRRSQPAHGDRLKRLLARVHRDYLFEEFDWVIDGRPVTDIEAYLSEDRSGRGIPLGRHARLAVWALYRQFSALLAEQGLATFHRLRADALDLVERIGADDDLVYDEVIVDEAQDLPPAALRLCLRLCRQPEGLLITADSKQSIYNRGFHWKRVDTSLALKGGRTARLQYNYRSTRQIVEAALQPLRDAGEPDSVGVGLRSVRQGPKPLLYRCRTEAEQIRRVADVIQSAAAELRLPVRSGAVLVPTNKVARAMAEGLTALGLTAVAVRGLQLTRDRRSLRVMTIHSAKGLEFPIVAVARVDSDQLPFVWGSRSLEERDALVAEGRRLLTVGLSRARLRMALICSRRRPSMFVSELDPGLWQEG